MNYRSKMKLFMIVGMIISSIDANAGFQLVGYNGSPLVWGGGSGILARFVNKSLVAMNNRGAIVYVVQAGFAGLGESKSSIFYKASEQSEQLKFSEPKDQIPGTILALYLEQEDSGSSESDVMKVAVERSRDRVAGSSTGGKDLYLETFRIVGASSGTPHLEQVGKSILVSDLGDKADSASDCGEKTCCALSFIPLCWCGCACSYMMTGYTEYSNVQFDSKGSLSGLAHWYTEDASKFDHTKKVQQVELFLVVGEDYKSITIPKNELTKLWNTHALKFVQFVFPQTSGDGKLVSISVLNKKEDIFGNKPVSLLFMNRAGESTKALVVTAAKSVLPFLPNPDGTFEAILEVDAPNTMTTRTIQSTFKLDGTFTDISSYYTPSLSEMFMAGRVYAFSPDGSKMLVKNIIPDARNLEKVTEEFAIESVSSYRVAR